MTNVHCPLTAHLGEAIGWCMLVALEAPFASQPYNLEPPGP
jgi:hypothetical protein